MRMTGDNEELRSVIWTYKESGMPYVFQFDDFVPATPWRGPTCAT
jgi:hypothetical protein